jgi:hypothetical protein
MLFWWPPADADLRSSEAPRGTLWVRRPPETWLFNHTLRHLLNYNTPKFSRTMSPAQEQCVRIRKAGGSSLCRNSAFLWFSVVRTHVQNLARHRESEGHRERMSPRVAVLQAIKNLENRATSKAANGPRAPRNTCRPFGRDQSLGNWLAIAEVQGLERA